MRPAQGEPVSLEEFGQDLFDAIMTQASLRAAFTTAQLYRDKSKSHAADQAEHSATALQTTLDAILKKNTIAATDLRRLLAMV
jgi:hypothetical protein